MDEPQSVSDGNVEQFPGTNASTFISDELIRLLAMLKDVCPEPALVSFEFDGRLHVHVDVRKREDALLVQAILPTLAWATFYSVSVGGTPNRPFYHRVSALVVR